MHIFFDLDGTLTDSSPGIVRCINHALVALGRAPLADAHLRSLIGAPLPSIFRELLESNDISAIDSAVAAYRERFNARGIFENRLYPGVGEALGELCRAGHTLQVVTAKPAPAAHRVLDHFAISACFAAVHGPALTDRTCDKGDLVAAALEVANGERHCAVMVGDRADDIRAARRHAVRAVAAGWGYGTHRELIDAAPDYVAPTLAHLRDWLRRWAA